MSMSAKEQNKLAGIFLMIHGGLQLVFVVILGLVYGGIGAAMFVTARRQEDQFAGMVFIVVMVFVVFIMMLFVIPQLVGGWKLLKERRNARIWGIIGSIVSCFSFPLGTAAGVFGLVFLFGDAGRAFYLGEAPGSYRPPQQPPPNSWQA